MLVERTEAFWRDTAKKGREYNVQIERNTDSF